MSFIIRLQNLSRFAKSSDIRAFFSSLQIPSGSVCIVGGDSGEAYIGFATDEDARQAMLRDGLVLCQNRVKLTLSSRKEMQEAMDRAQQMSSVMKNVEKSIRPEARIINPNIQAARPGPMPTQEPYQKLGSNADFNQVNKNRPSENYTAGTSWLSSPNKPQETNASPVVDNSWKDFLEQALQRIEKAKDSGQPNAPIAQQNEPKPTASMLGPPRHFNSSQENRPKFNQQVSQKPSNLNSFHSPTKPAQQSVHEYGQIIEQNNGNKFPINNYRQANQQRFPGSGTHKPLHMQPRHSPPPIHKIDIAPAPLESEFEATLRQQQLAAVEQMAMPAISQAYDPEELFVEFSRLPPSLVDLNSFKQFLLPVVPNEIRIAFSGEMHMCTVCFFANQMDANSFINRDGESGIKIRWSSRRAFYALPQLQQNLSQLNPHVWDIPTNDVLANKRSMDLPFESDIKRAKIDIPDFNRHENSWTTPIHSTPSQQNVYYILLTNLHFKVKSWDLQKCIEQEIDVRPLKITHLHSADNERSDKWMIECSSADEANRIVENPPFLFGRQTQADTLSTEAAQDIYANGYQPVRKRRDQHFHQNDGGKPSFSQNPNASAKSGTKAGGFFSGSSAYGKIRSATMPNPTASSVAKVNQFESEQYEKNGNFGRERKEEFGFKGRGRGGNRGSYRHSGPANRGNFNSRGQKRGGFRGGRFHRGNKEMTT